MQVDGQVAYFPHFQNDVKRLPLSPHKSFEGIYSLYKVVSFKLIISNFLDMTHHIEPYKKHMITRAPL